MQNSTAQSRVFNFILSSLLLRLLPPSLYFPFTSNMIYHSGGLRLGWWVVGRNQTGCNAIARTINFMAINILVVNFLSHSLACPCSPTGVCSLEISHEIWTLNWKKINPFDILQRRTGFLKNLNDAVYTFQSSNLKEARQLFSAGCLYFIIFPARWN